MTLGTQGADRFLIRPLLPQDAAWVRPRLIERWGGERIVVHGQVFWPAQLPGLVALEAEQSLGLLTYSITGQACEIVTLDSWQEGIGVGTALLEAVRRVAGAAGCRRLLLLTTNDNTAALRFYQKRGFVLAALHVNAVSRARALKPEIPLLGRDGIPIRDEIELELIL